MIYNIVQIITFQLLFLFIYDVFLRKETFFQYNRAYLLITSCLGILLPFVELKSLAHVIPGEYMISLPEAVSGTTENITAATVVNSFWAYFSWQEWIFIIGAVCSLLWFCIKLYALLTVKLKATVEVNTSYTKVIIKNSHAAFSFFKTIFLGDAILARDHDVIIKHELVHVRQKHSLDLLYFELLRIVFWFNPLIYIYQKRISEVHEFIADAEADHKSKKEQYRLLLSMVFKTRNISFINQFFKRSLIKKRIIMLQKSKSKKARQLKYLLLVPVLLSMLVYASCEQETPAETLNNTTAANGEITVKVNDINKLSEEELNIISALRTAFLNEKERKTNSLKIILTDGKQTSYMTMEGEAVSIDKTRKQSKGVDVPFATIEEAPVFPGCEDSEDRRKCFQEKMMQHISNNFKYPDEAQQFGIQGRVAVLFIISKDGEIINIRTRGAHKSIEEEAERIISLLPKMQPGKHKGEAVNVPFSIPITFRLK